MASRIEPELLVQLTEALAKHRNFLDGCAKRLAGPKPDMDSDAGDLATFSNRNDNEIERDSTMDGRLAIGFRHQRDFAALLEIANGAHAAAFVGRLARKPEDTERFGRLAGRPFDMVAQQGHCPIGEPVEQGLAFIAFDAIGVGLHLRLQGGPIRDRGADIGQSAMKLGNQLRSGAGVGPVDLDIHDRFAPFLFVAKRLDRDQAAIGIALDADHRMKQAMDDEAARGDRRRHRIHQERHVVIGDAQAHPAMAELGAQGFQADESNAVRATGGAGGDELGGGAAVLGTELVEFARERAFAQGPADGRDQSVTGRSICPAASAASSGSDLVRGNIIGVHNYSGGGIGGQPGFGRAYSPPGLAAARLVAECDLFNDDAAAHSESGMQAMRAAQPVAALCRDQAHRHALAWAHFDRAFIDRHLLAGSDAGGSEESRCGEIVTAFAGVDQPEHHRLAGPQPDLARAEIEIGKPDLDRGRRDLGRRRRQGGEEEGCKQQPPHGESPAPVAISIP